MFVLDQRSFQAGTCFGLAVAAFLAFAFWVASPWVRSLLSGGRLSAFHVVGMRLRGSPVNLLLDAHLSLVHDGHSVPIEDIESKYVAHRTEVVSSKDLVDLVLADPKRTPCPES